MSRQPSSAACIHTAVLPAVTPADPFARTLLQAVETGAPPSPEDDARKEVIRARWHALRAQLPTLEDDAAAFDSQFTTRRPAVETDPQEDIETQTDRRPPPELVANDLSAVSPPSGVPAISPALDPKSVSGVVRRAVIPHAVAAASSRPPAPIPIVAPDAPAPKPRSNRPVSFCCGLIAGIVVAVPLYIGVEMPVYRQIVLSRVTTLVSGLR